VRDNSGNRARAARNKLLGGLHEGAGADREVINHNGVVICDVADDLYYL
jgi:hypothetical protein